MNAKMNARSSRARDKQITNWIGCIPVANSHGSSGRMAVEWMGANRKWQKHPTATGDYLFVKHVASRQITTALAAMEEEGGGKCNRIYAMAIGGR